ncbi:MFS transporter [Microbacterium excoecariae]|uniref:MFS transporter n=1 Tax=Microbacterium excoecariae TaxID=2715210 RepID=UPI0014091442|nr:MFS transporter [Microbacterium excoecariae]NHI15574.1 MFS transporter [Microbacterium excoecariae]
MSQNPLEPAVPPVTTTTVQQSRPADKVPRRGSNMVLLGGSMVVDGGESGLVNSLFPVIQAALGLATSALGVLSAVGRLIGAVAGPFWVFLARKLGRRWVLAIATGFWGLWGVAAGLSQSFAQLLVLYAIMAAGTAAAHALVPTVISDSYPDRSRGRVVGWVYGVVAAAGSVAAPLVAQLANIEDGWRYAFFIFGGLNVLFGALILVFYRDPGEGAAEQQLSSFDQTQRDSADNAITWARVVGLMRIRSYVVLLGSRLLSSHMVLAAFGVVLLVNTYGFDTPVAATVMAPFGIGYLAGTIVGGMASDAVNRISANYGRVAFLQVAQVLFAVAAYFATQFDYASIVPFLVMFGFAGLAQGLNPGVNRPLVMAVVPPELRGAAFAIFVSVIESLGFAIYTLVGGFLADAVGLQVVMLWIVCGVMLVNAAFLTLLYRPFRRDREALQATLDARRARILAASAPGGAAAE